MLIRYGRRLIFAAYLLLVIRGVPAVAASVFGDGSLALVVTLGLMVALFLPAAVVFDSVEHGLPAFGGCFTRR